jgi:hypothetical protein
MSEHVELNAMLAMEILRHQKDHYGNHAEWAYDMATDALKKQMAKAPTRKADEIDERCPDCGCCVSDNYCPECGQAILWVNISCD